MPEFLQRCDTWDQPELKVDETITEKWIDTDLMVLHKEFEDLVRQVQELPWDAGLRVMGAHRQLLIAHPFIVNYDQERFYCAALEQALIWEVG